jgi:hypothetical protein
MTTPAFPRSRRLQHRQLRLLPLADHRDQPNGNVGTDHQLDRTSTASNQAGRRTGVPPARTTCPRCGYRAQAGPGDGLVVAAARVPGEFRAKLAEHGPLETIDARLRERPVPSGWSPLERVAHVADELHVAAGAVAGLLEGRDDRYSRARIDAPRAGSNAWPMQAVLGSLQAGAIDLGRALGPARRDEWDHLHLLRDDVITLRGLVEATLHEAQHHLFEIDRALAAQRGSAHGAVST